MIGILVLAAWITIAVVAAIGLVGCVWYTIKHHAHLKTLSKMLQTVSGRAQTTEATIQRIIGHIESVVKRLEKAEKSIQKVSTNLGQVNKQAQTDGEYGYSKWIELANELGALAEALGYEVKTVDAGPVPVVTAIEAGKPQSKPRVRAAQ